MCNIIRQGGLDNGRLKNIPVGALAELIIARTLEGEESKPKFIIVGGAPAVGKTLICKMFSRFCPRNVHIEMESYFYHSRAERRKLGLNGFDLESYNTELMNNDFLRLIKQRSFAAKRYDHGKGFLPDAVEVHSDSIIAYEGFAFFSLLQRFNSFCIGQYFIFPTSINEWLRIHMERDQHERGSLVSYDILRHEAHQKANSLAKSITRLNQYLRQLTYLRVDYAANEFSNTYSFAIKDEGDKFLDEFDKL